MQQFNENDMRTEQLVIPDLDENYRTFPDYFSSFSTFGKMAYFPGF